MAPGSQGHDHLTLLYRAEWATGQPLPSGRKHGLPSPADATNSEREDVHCVRMGQDTMPHSGGHGIQAEIPSPHDATVGTVLERTDKTSQRLSQDRSTRPTIWLVGRGRESPDPHASFFSLYVNAHPLDYKRGETYPSQGHPTFAPAIDHHAHILQRLGTPTPSLVHL